MDGDDLIGMRYLVAALVHAAGGEVRVTRADSIKAGLLTLERVQDPTTDDLIFRAYDPGQADPPAMRTVSSPRFVLFLILFSAFVGLATWLAIR